MKKEVKNGQGFNCKNLVERSRIWKKLEDAGYPMFHKRSTIGIHSYIDYPHIVYEHKYFCFCKNAISIPLNEAEFFGETEWTPKPGEWVEALIYNVWEPHVFVTYWDEKYWIKRNDIYKLHPCCKIRQIKPETMTLKEAQENLRELLNKPDLTIEP
jgi:hypothetical protein